MGRSLKAAVSAVDLARDLGIGYSGSSDSFIFRVDDAASATGGSLCFAKDLSWASRVDNRAVIIMSGQSVPVRSAVTLLSDYPRLDFARALTLIDKSVGFEWLTSEPDIHPTVRIGRNVTIGRGVKIGAETTIHHNVVIGDEVIIGRRCNIKSSAVIGEEGFGFERDARNRAVRLVHIGRVVIEDDVEVGSLTTICRGTINDTVLKNGCKIDDHVHIAHNVVIGEDAFVIACAEVSGGVSVGARSWIAPNATIINQVSIGEDSVIGLGAVVIKSVPNETTVVGNPAKPLSK
jgi:UDP-3-O-[3-hydroxymyristoyl] glucosamine N-acyltransferase